MKPGQVDGLVVFSKLLKIRVQILDDNSLVKGNRAKPFDDDLPVDLKGLMALLNKRLVGVVNVPLVAELIENVENPRFRSHLRIFLKSQPLSNAVSREKADTEDVCSQAVGVLFHHLD